MLKSYLTVKQISMNQHELGPIASQLDEAACKAEQGSCDLLRIVFVEIILCPMIVNFDFSGIYCCWWITIRNIKPVGSFPNQSILCCSVDVFTALCSIMFDHIVTFFVNT